MKDFKHGAYKDLSVLPASIFGRWTVISVFRRGRLFARVRCACGTEKVTRARHLVSGLSSSCGCYAAERARAVNSEKRKKPIGYASSRFVFNTYKCNAVQRGYDFSLSFEEFLRLASMPCHYCNECPSNECLVRKNANGSFIYSGIDRVDNNVGYCAANVVPCCARCNRAKNKSTLADFLSWISRIKSFRQRNLN